MITVDYEWYYYLYFAYCFKMYLVGVSGQDSTLSNKLQGFIISIAFWVL